MESKEKDCEYENSNDYTYNIEKSPNIALYRQPDTVSGDFCERPALHDLHECKNNQANNERFRKSSTLGSDRCQSNAPTKIVKLGWGSGVMLRGVLSIIGTMLFLRLGFVMGEAGILLGLFIIVFSVAICLSTTLSLSAIATNGLVRGGGAYFLLSRTLGPEWGLVTGVVLSVSNCLSASLCLVGFAETVKAILDDFGIRYMISEVNDIRFISILALSLIIVLVIASIKYETAFMYILMILLAVSMVNFLIGSIMPSNLDKISKGIIGFSKFALSQNLKPKLKFGLSVGQIFGIFFPAMTGVLAGVNISGNLRDPNKAIPRGTIAALLISTLIYLLTALIFVTSTLPATQGTIHEIFEIPANISLSQCAHSLDLPKITLICPNITNGTVDGNDVFISARNLSTPLNTTENHSNGLLYDYNIMKSISAYGPLTYAGLFAATLSSASAAFVAAPKIFQALCRDDLLPTMFRFFAVGHPQTDEPQRGYILCFIVIASLNLVGYLNRLAIFVAECTLFCYVLINYACSEMCSSKSLGWRPKFRWYNKYLSKITLVVIVAAMFVIEWRYAIFTYGVVGALFLYAKHRKLENNWGSPRQAHLYTKGLSCIQKFVNLDLHVKNFRPQCLVLTGYPSERPHLLHLIKQITGSHNLAIAGHVIWRNKRSLTLRIRENRSAQQWLRDNNYKLFYSQIQAKSLREGVSAMMQCSGVGQFRPNILVIGFKNAYRNLDIIDETLDYFEIIHDAFDLSMNVMIVRFQSKIQASGDLGCVTDEQAQEDEHLSSPSSIRIKTTQKEFTIRYEIDGKSNDLTSSKHVDNNANLTKTSLHSILHNKRCNEFVGIYLKRMKEETRVEN